LRCRRLQGQAPPLDLFLIFFLKTYYYYYFSFLLLFSFVNTAFYVNNYIYKQPAGAGALQPHKVFRPIASFTPAPAFFERRIK